MTDTSEAQDSGKRYCVYEHLFPNGKRYIGISSDAEHRWQNGTGYKNQKKVWNAIQRYGWDNIEHNIIVAGITREQAATLERALIAAYDAIENGYNATIGGDEILETYLEPHVLQMITQSKHFDAKCGLQQVEDDIVSLAEKAKFNKQLARRFNEADRLVQNEFREYKTYKGQTLFYDLGNARIDCYWWTMAKILSGCIDELRNDHQPYWTEWLRVEWGIIS